MAPSFRRGAILGAILCFCAVNVDAHATLLSLRRRFWSGEIGKNNPFLANQSPEANLADPIPDPTSSPMVDAEYTATPMTPVDVAPAAPVVEAESSNFQTFAAEEMKVEAEVQQLKEDVAAEEQQLKEQEAQAKAVVQQAVQQQKEAAAQAAADAKKEIEEAEKKIQEEKAAAEQQRQEADEATKQAMEEEKASLAKEEADREAEAKAEQDRQKAEEDAEKERRANELQQEKEDREKAAQERREQELQEAADELEQLNNKPTLQSEPPSEEPSESTENQEAEEEEHRIEMQEQEVEDKIHEIEVMPTDALPMQEAEEPPSLMPATFISPDTTGQLPAPLPTLPPTEPPTEAPTEPPTEPPTPEPTPEPTPDCVGTTEEPQIAVEELLPIKPELIGANEFDDNGQKDVNMPILPNLPEQLSIENDDFHHAHQTILHAQNDHRLFSEGNVKNCANGLCDLTEETI